MRLRGRCDTIRVGVVGCGLFATPNSLKSHKRQKELSPVVQHSCHNAKVVHAFEANTPFEKLPGTQINVPRLNLHKRPRHRTHASFHAVSTWVINFSLSTRNFPVYAIIDRNAAACSSEPFGGLRPFAVITANNRPAAVSAA